MSFPQYEVMMIGTEMDIAQTISGTTARNVLDLSVADTSTSASGYHRGIYLNWTATGDKTGTAEINGIASDITLTGANTPYSYNLTAYQVATSNPTIGYASGLSIYFDNLGTNLGALVGVDIMLGLTTAPADRYTYIRCRDMVTSVPTSVLLCEANCATYLLKADPTVNFLDTGTTAGNQCVGHIAFKVGNNTRYINFYSDNS
ncbi:MAG: hypothetical protein MUP81_05785 [Dehalococcoidia bacterium]|nr:hypothetical protein [Dehalococcoidia bacterium]